MCIKEGIKESVTYTRWQTLQLPQQNWPLGSASQAMLGLCWLFPMNKRTRICEHRSRLKHGKLEVPLVSHFQEQKHNYEEFKFFIIEQIRQHDFNNVDRGFYYNVKPSGFIDLWCMLRMALTFLLIYHALFDFLFFMMCLWKRNSVSNIYYCYFNIHCCDFYKHYCNFNNGCLKWCCPFIPIAAVWLYKVNGNK